MVFQNSILNQVSKSLKTSKKSLVVFDLDSTLFDVTNRVFKIVQDFASMQENKELYPNATEFILNLKEYDHTYYLKDQIQSLGLTNEPESFYKALFNYWKTHFFSNDYLKYDEPYPGASNYVQHLHRDFKNTEIMYLTGRDIHRMKDGTIHSLNQFDFPLNNKALLKLKPHRTIPDADFKLQEFEKLEKSYDQIWFFENEPSNIHPIIDSAIKIDIVYFDSVHSQKMPEPKDLPSIKNFL